MSTPLKVGVLLTAEVQLLDVSSVDLFVSLGRPVEITYISSSFSSSSQTTQVAAVTASAALRVTANLTSASVAPGKLDILLIPGPDPTAEIPENVLQFIKAQYEAEADVLSVCTGIMALVMSGVLEGKKGTGPRVMLGMLREKFQGTEWVDKRWVANERVWCSGGITNGLDMVAAYLRAKFPGELVELVCGMADVGGRGQEYE